MTNPYSKRLANLRGRMAETATDLVALGPSSHMEWLSGVNPHGDERPVMLLITQSYAGFLIPTMNTDSARQTTDLPFHDWGDNEGPAQALSDVLKACELPASGASVVLDETMRTDFSLLLLDALEKPTRRFTQDTVGLLRAMKDETEFDLLKASAVLNDAAIYAGFDALEAGMTEEDVAAVILDHYKANGASPAFNIVGFGPNAAFPHHHTGKTKLEEGMCVLIDSGCRLGGYPSDMTRMGWFGGEPDPEFVKVHAIVEDAVQAALAAAKPGVPGSAIDKAARDVITAAGYGPNFLHRTGHGLGLDVHEPPYMTATNNVPLEEGNVFSIEPGIYLAGRFGVRLEDIVILRGDGPEIFSETSRAYWQG